MTEKIARLRFELLHIEPCIWRSVEVSLKTNLRSLHELIQAVMPWEGYHLYEFTIGERAYGEPDPEDAAWGRKTYQAKGMQLGKLIERSIIELLYTYDFGDNWQHRIVVEHVEDADPATDYPRFVAGERTAPPEDVGGPSGFMEFTKAIANRRHPQHKEMVRWYGGPFHPTDFGKAEVAARVRVIAARRKIALEAFARSQQLRQP
ncbi:plasmid pRiA4b ORF-3 family protein [Paracoccus nototheniae]|uniref:Plasmid pRiA4b ORF-3 family protein n=1 Tax=Paracoccus nototheniae TaxID=2489002 RepID=A0ABW4DU12_9RHOB|nr:plasmid pRiA4b ORF-3 family protein [Paracoccus nototheniae]